MGEKRIKDMRDRDYALARSPYCIFCGGVVPANSADHLPPKGIFTERRFPEGYVFPACEPCNFGSKRYDKIIAFLSRLDPSSALDNDERHAQEISKQFNSLANERPHEVRQLFNMSAVRKKAAAEQMRIPRPPGTLYRDMPFVDIPDWMHEAVDHFMIKLTKALHFHHTGLIVPASAGIKSRWFTNASFLSGKIPAEVFTVPGNKPNLVRAKVDLSDQFNYRYVVTDDRLAGVYSVFFRFAFCFTAVVAFDPSLLETDDGEIRGTDHQSPAQDSAQFSGTNGTNPL